MYKDNVAKQKIPLLLGNTRVRGHFFVSIYTVMSKKEICYKSQMKKFVLETIDFSSIFKGYRIPIPFFLLCIDINNKEKLIFVDKQKISQTLNFTDV